MVRVGGEGGGGRWLEVVWDERGFSSSREKIF